MKEVEVKAVLRDPQAVIQKLQSMGCEISRPKSQKDIKFLPNGMPDDQIKTGTHVLRMRDQDGKHIFTLKQTQANELDCVEKETVVEKPGEVIGMLGIMGYREVLRISKVRRTCKYRGLEICIDNVEGLGDFIEVESMTEELDGEKVQGQLFEFLKTLGVGDKDRVVNGYDTLLYMKAQGRLPSNINPK